MSATPTSPPAAKVYLNKTTENLREKIEVILSVEAATSAEAWDLFMKLKGAQS